MSDTNSQFHNDERAWLTAVMLATALAEEMHKNYGDQRPTADYVDLAADQADRILSQVTRNA